MSAAAVESALGNVRIEGSQDVIVGSNINKSNGSLVLDAGRDVRFETVGDPAFVGCDHCPTVMSFSSLGITATALDVDAGRNVIDNVAAAGTQLRATVADLRIFARTGSADWGRAFVSPGKAVRIEQSDAFTLNAGDDSQIGDPLTTRVFVESINDIVRIAPSDDGTVRQHDYLSLHVNGVRGVVIDADVRTAEKSIYKSDDTIVVRGNLIAGDDLFVNAGRDGTGTLRWNATSLFAQSPNIVLIGGSLGSTGDASVDALTNAPKFYSPGGPGTSPGAFTISQNNTIRTEDLPDPSQFGGSLTCDTKYTLQSYLGDVFINQANTVGGADLVLASASKWDTTLDRRAYINDNLSLCTLLIEGRATLNADVTTQNSQTYTGPTRLDRDVRLTGGAFVRFADVLNSVGGESNALTINAPRAIIEKDAGTLMPLAALTVNGGIEFYAPGAGPGTGIRVVTQGDQRYNGTTTLLCDLNLTSLASADPATGNAGTIRFGGDVNGPHALTVQTQPGGLIVFGGDAGTTAPLAKIDLCTVGEVTGRVVPNRATIVGEGDTTIRAGEWVVCEGEKFTVLGNLDLLATTRATISDINTLGYMRVSSPDINILRRPASVILKPGGASEVDGGVDFVAGGDITFDGPVRTSGKGPDPRFGSSTGVFNGSGIQSFDRVTMPRDQTDLNALVDALFVRVLDQRVPAAVPPPPPPPPVRISSLIDGRPRDPRLSDSVIPSVYDVNLLRRIAVQGRGVTGGEARGANRAGRYVYESITGTGFSLEELAATRFDYDAVVDVVDTYDFVFGQGESSRVTAMQSELSTAMCKYQFANPGPIDSKKFAWWLTSRSENEELSQSLSEVRVVLRKLQRLGLTPGEYRDARARVMAQLVTNESLLSADALGEITEVVGTADAIPEGVIPTATRDAIRNYTSPAV
jgi:hypothetical protein